MLDIGKLVFDNKSEVVEILANPGMGVVTALQTYAEQNGIVFHDIRLDTFGPEDFTPWALNFYEKKLNLTEQPTLVVLTSHSNLNEDICPTYPFVSLSSPTCKVVKVKYR